MHNKVHSLTHTDTHTLYREKATHKHTNIHNRKSVSEWEGAGRLAGAVLVEDMASVHLSISKHSQLSSLSTDGEVISLVFSSLRYGPFLISAFPFCPSLLARLIYLPGNLSFHILPPLLFISPPSVLLLFLCHSALLLAVPSTKSPERPVELAIQRENKAADSIARWLIKQNQNPAALRSTQQHRDTGQQWHRLGGERVASSGAEDSEGGVRKL